MAKISSYPNNASPDSVFEFIGTDPSNETEGSTGTTQTVTLATITGKSLPLPTGGTYPGGTTEFLRADQTWAVPPGTGGGGGGSGLVDWKDLVGTYGADPTGATSASSALAAACTAATAAQPATFGLTVPPGTYLLTAGQAIPYNMVMRGAGASGGDVSEQFVGSIFNLSSSFSGTYAFEFTDTSHVSGATGVNGAVVSGIYLDGSAYSAEAVNGFYIYGPTMCTFSDITIAQMSGWAVSTGADSAQTETTPFGQTWTGVTADSCGKVTGGNFQLIGCEDSVFTGIYSIGAANGPGFLIEACDNAKFTACNSEWNIGTDGFGYYITGDWTYYIGGCLLTGCSTDANGTSGYYQDATWTTGQGGGTGPGLIHVTGCHFRRDGSGTYPSTTVTGSAGITLAATTLPVIFSGFSTYTGTPDGETTPFNPEYGIYLTASSYSAPVIFSGGLAWGVTDALYLTNESSHNVLPTNTTTLSFTGVLLAHGDNNTPTYGS